MDGQLRFLLWLLVGIAGIAALHIGALQWQVYWMVWWFDVLVHTVAGAWVALALVWLLRRWWWYAVPPAQADRWLAVGVGGALLVGIGWEVFEVLIGVPVTGETYILDTGIDLTADAIGAFGAMVAITHLLTPSWLYDHPRDERPDDLRRRRLGDRREFHARDAGDDAAR